MAELKSNIGGRKWNHHFSLYPIIGWHQLPKWENSQFSENLSNSNFWHFSWHLSIVFNTTNMSLSSPSFTNSFEYDFERRIWKHLLSKYAIFGQHQLKNNLMFFGGGTNATFDAFYPMKSQCYHRPLFWILIFLKYQIVSSYPNAIKIFKKLWRE